jgi:predicted RNA binding protein YcfA (HicA-like mRNA interferase family)
VAKLPSVSGKIAIKAFVKIGYNIARQKGSHIRLLHPNRDPLTIPNHKLLGRGLLRKLLRDAQLSVDDFVDLLRN